MTNQRAILEALQAVHPFTQAKTTLFSDVRIKLPNPPTLAEFETELGKLEAARQIVGVSHQDKGTVYKLTAEGLARLAE